MADAARFPNLAVPFAITGAAGGWLSAGLVQHPLAHEMNVPFRITAALVAAVFGLVTGVLLRGWCVGRRYAFQLDAPDPDTRPVSDTWFRHVLTILVAGSAAGAIACTACGMAPLVEGALGGLLCTLPFLPICVAVLSTARRAQRARLGSIVAGADRRAVWRILAATLLIATLESLLDWPAGARAVLAGPLPAFGLVVVATVCILMVLAADALALRRATRAVAAGLARRDLDDASLDHEAAARIDLGLGKDLHAHVARSVHAYRSRERALALILGDPQRAVTALRRALRRDIVAFALAPFVLALHVAAGTDTVAAHYQEISCRLGNGPACAAVVEHKGSLEPRDVLDAVFHYQRGCDRGDGWSCMSVARLYSGKEGASRDAAMVALFEYRAAQRGICPVGTVLVTDYHMGAERVCVLPNDPRVPGIQDFK